MIEEYKAQQKMKSENRWKLLTRWQDDIGREQRAKILNDLYKRKQALDEASALRANDVSVYESPPGVDLRGIDFSGENLDGVDLSYARLQGANLARASCKGTTLLGADLRDTFLRKTDFTEADLRGANLCGALLEDTLLDNAMLDGAWISQETVVVRVVLPTSVRRSKVSAWFANTLTVSE